MKALNRIIMVFLAFILLIGVSGCMEEKNDFRADVAKEKALEHLNSYYVDTFTPVSYTDAVYDYDYQKVVFKSKKYPDALIEVRIYGENDNVSFSDNYFKYFMHDDAVKLFEDIVAKTLKDSHIKVEFNAAVTPAAILSTSTFADYVASGTCSVRLFVFTNEEVSVDAKNKILNNIVEHNIIGSFCFMQTSDENIFRDYTIKEIMNEHSDKILERSDCYIDKSFKIKIG